jgi:hypothetical protein
MNGPMHRIRTPSKAETPGLVTGPTPVGENQEKTIDSTAATLKGVRTAE